MVAAMNRGTYSFVSRRISRVFEISEKLSTLALWTAPLIVLLSAIWFAVSASSRRRDIPDPGRSLTVDEKQKLDALQRDDPSIGT